MTRTLSPFQLAYSILAGPVWWFVHFVIVYIAAEFGCGSNFNNLLVFTPETIRLIIVVVTVVMLGLVGVGGWLAYRNWQGLPDNPTATSQEAAMRFLAQVSVLLNGLFWVSIVVTTVPTFFLNVCDWAA